LARREAAITSPIAGTTRDVIEVAIDLAGYPVVLPIRRGLRDSADVIEQEGLRRALKPPRRLELRSLCSMRPGPRMPKAPLPGRPEHAPRRQQDRPGTPAEMRRRCPRDPGFRADRRRPAQADRRPLLTRSAHLRWDGAGIDPGAAIARPLETALAGLRRSLAADLPEFGRRFAAGLAQPGPDHLGGSMSRISRRYLPRFLFGEVTGMM